MSNGSSAVVSGIAIAVLSGASVSGFNLYTDVQLLKSQTAAIERTIEEREETTKRFTQLMLQMDKTLAVQTEAVNTLKDAVRRLESGGFLAYSKEDFHDSRK